MKCRLHRYGSPFWRFETKTIFFDGYPLYDLLSEHLVVGFHINQVNIGKHIGEKGQETITNSMPKVKRVMRPASHELRTKNNISLILYSRFNKKRIFGRIIFQVGVLELPAVCWVWRKSGTKGENKSALPEGFVKSRWRSPEQPEDYSPWAWPDRFKRFFE